MTADREANLLADRPDSELLRGAYDGHVDAAPDVVPRAQDWLEVGEAARAAGVAGLVIKNDTGSTAGQAQLLNRVFPDGPRFFGSLTLNPPVGGLNPHAVAAVLRLISQIRRVGPEHIVLSSDFGQAANGPPVAALTKHLNEMRSRELNPQDIHTMMVSNPARLLIQANDCGK